MRNKDCYSLTQLPRSIVAQDGNENFVSDKKRLQEQAIEISNEDIEGEEKATDEVGPCNLTNKYSSKRRLILYYVGGALGYFAVLNEFAMAKFIFDSNFDGLNTLGIEVFDVSNPSKVAITCVTLPLTLINLFDSFSAISPLTDSAKFLRLKIIKDQLIQDNNVLIEKSISPNKLFLIRLIPCTAAIVTFISGSFGSWLGINSVLKNYPIANYSLGLISSPLGIFYSILLSWNDVLNSIDDFRKINNSAAGKLFVYSKSTFVLANSRLLINLLYRSSIYVLIAKGALNEIFNVTEGTNLAGVVSFGAAAIFTVFTRLTPITQNYLKPFQISDGNYNFGRISDVHRSRVINNMRTMDYLRIAQRSLPIGLIRAIAVFYLLYNQVSALFEEEDYFWGKLLGSILGLVLGSLLLIHVIYVERKHAINELAAKELNQNQTFTNPSQRKALSRIIASFFNVGVQSTHAFLEVASFISMVGGIVGKPTAATFGLLVGAESGWVNFFYIQPKYENRVDEIISNFGRLKHIRFPFFSRNNFQRNNDDQDANILSSLQFNNEITNEEIRSLPIKLS